MELVKLKKSFRIFFFFKVCYLEGNADLVLSLESDHVSSENNQLSGGSSRCSDDTGPFNLFSVHLQKYLKGNSLKVIFMFQCGYQQKYVLQCDSGHFHFTAKM